MSTHVRARNRNSATRRCIVSIAAGLLLAATATPMASRADDSHGAPETKSETSSRATATRATATRDTSQIVWQLPQWENGLLVINADGSGSTKHTLAGQSHSPQLSRDGKKIVYVQFITPSNERIGVMNVDGGDNKSLTEGTHRCTSPRWSPDNRKIAYLSGNAPAALDEPAALDDKDAQTFEFGHAANEIWIMNADGSGKKRVLQTLNAHDVRWSPDGKRLAFLSLSLNAKKDVPGTPEYHPVKGMDADLYTVNLDGGGLRRWTQGMNIEEPPAWSGDNRKIAFVADGIFVVDAVRSGAKPLRLTTNTAGMDMDVGGFYRTRRDKSPSWQPDGQHLVFSRVESFARMTYWETAAIHLLDTRQVEGPDNVARKIIEAAPRKDGETVSDREPSFSPDGKRIVFTRSSGSFSEENGVYVVNADGRNLQQWVQSSGSEQRPEWR